MGGSALVDGASPVNGGVTGRGNLGGALICTNQSGPPSLPVADKGVLLKPKADGQSGNTQVEVFGKSLEGLRQQLLDAGNELAQCVEPAGRDLVGETAQMLEKQVCRVAVVGQIKSGKSSFINAFSQQPGLLPTDVNPWTTAVTNLHFKEKAPQGCVAMFRFFAESEWQELVEGAGRLRELTQRLVPGFEPELLRQHVDTLRRRAASRLGADFQTLLGKSHTFSKVDTDLLQRYVCSGVLPGGSGVAQAQGHFSDITKTADIYCEDGPFEFPVTLVDTPGTNDPFLLRDEVTRSSLEAADLYIVVLTARQPLAESDVALLRILRGLHKERILIFINRVDDLADIASDVDEVTEFVRKRIEKEFPGAEIPVIAGSARWASCAMESDRGDLESMLRPRTRTYLQEIGALEGRDDAEASGTEVAKNEELRRGLFLASGIPAAYEALSRMLGTSHCAHVLRQVAQCYGELARGGNITARGELDQLNSTHSSAVSTAHDASETLRKINSELRHFDDMTTVIEQSARDLEQKLRGIIAEEMSAMREQMDREIFEQAREEADVLVDTLRRGRMPKVWRCEVSELRGRLGQRFQSGFERAASRVLELQARVSPELHQLKTMLAPNEAAPGEPNQAQMEIPSPSQTSLGRFVALDLGESWWRAWWSRSPGHDERGRDLEQLIVSEFQPVVEDLVGGATQALDRYCTVTLRWSFAMCRNLIQSLQRRAEHLRENSQILSRSVDGAADSKTVVAQAQRISDLRERAQRCDKLGRECEQVYRRLSKMLQRVPEL